MEMKKERKWRGKSNLGGEIFSGLKYQLLLDGRCLNRRWNVTPVIRRLVKGRKKLQKMEDLLALENGLDIIRNPGLNNSGLYFWRLRHSLNSFVGLHSVSRVEFSRSLTNKNRDCSSKSSLFRFNVLQSNVFVRSGGSSHPGTLSTLLFR